MTTRYSRNALEMPSPPLSQTLEQRLYTEEGPDTHANIRTCVHTYAYASSHTLKYKNMCNLVYSVSKYMSKHAPQKQFPWYGYWDDHPSGPTTMVKT